MERKKFKNRQSNADWVNYGTPIDPRKKMARFIGSKNEDWFDTYSS